jgi:hypothetical protein
LGGRESRERFGDEEQKDAVEEEAARVSESEKSTRAEELETGAKASRRSSLEKIFTISSRIESNGCDSRVAEFISMAGSRGIIHTKSRC